MLPAAHRLRTAELLTVLKRHQSVFGGGVTFKYLRHNSEKSEELSHFAFVVPSKAVKRAVDRNLLKRRARHAVSKYVARCRPGYWGVFFLSASLLKIPAAVLEQTISRLLHQAKII